jgi:hypothetical protein
VGYPAVFYLGILELHMLVVLWLAINTINYRPSKNIQDSHSQQNQTKPYGEHVQLKDT